MKKILIVDDQQEVRELVEVTLRGGPYQILQAASGEEALEVARREKPDLIILDIMMPGGMDGFETCQKLKDDAETRSCRVLFLTAKGQQVDQERGLEMGAVGYFVKPFSPLELLARVEEVLEEGE
jgi:DNA-binding response OmpR family regulator